MNKLQVALVFGSINSEHDISVASAASVLEHFPKEKFDCVPLYIGKDGKWYTGNYTLDMMQSNKLEGHRELYLQFNYDRPGFIYADDQSLLPVDVAFLMLHGRMGEGGQVQGLLKCANIPFTGCDVLSSALCMDKGFTHIICEAAGIDMAAYQLITHINDIDFEKVEYPCIVKPSREGSSFGVSYVRNYDELLNACLFAFEFDSRVLIEAYIKGTEVGLGILKTDQELIVSEVDQVYVSGEVFDFQEKYHPHATETLPVSTFPESVRKEVKRLGELAFNVLDCAQFSRLDFFVTEDHRIFLNEVNTIPGFTSSSRYPGMLNRAGVSYPELITKMIEDLL